MCTYEFAMTKEIVNRGLVNFDLAQTEIEYNVTAAFEDVQQPSKTLAKALRNVSRPQKGEKTSEK